MSLDAISENSQVTAERDSKQTKPRPAEVKCLLRSIVDICLIRSIIFTPSPEHNALTTTGQSLKVVAVCA